MKLTSKDRVNNFHGFEGLKFEEAKVVIFPIPYEATTSYQKGTALGPRAIIEASMQIEVYDIEFRKEVSDIFPIFTLEDFTADLGSHEKNHKKLTESVKKILLSDKFLISLGGEHSITPSLASAFIEKFQNLTILSIDAHLDLRDSYHGTKYSHAATMRRCFEKGINIVSVGVRSLCQEEADFIEKNKLQKNIFFGHEFSLEKVINACTDYVYLSVDLDGLDPGIMPSVGTPEPGGLNWRQVIEIISALAKNKNLVGADVVELMPIPGLLAPDFLAAKLVYKIIGNKFLTK